MLRLQLVIAFIHFELFSLNVTTFSSLRDLVQLKLLFKSAC